MNILEVNLELYLGRSRRNGKVEMDLMLRISP